MYDGQAATDAHPGGTGYTYELITGGIDNNSTKYIFLVKIIEIYRFLCIP